MTHAMILNGGADGRGGPRRPARHREQPSPYLATIGRADAPEQPLVVEFVGITDDEQAVAIAGFPGGRRFVLAGRHQSPTRTGGAIATA